MFIYSEKATKFCEISTVDLSYIVAVKSTVDISKKIVAFSENMNFNKAKEQTRAYCSILYTVLLSWKSNYNNKVELWTWEF